MDKLRGCESAARPASELWLSVIAAAGDEVREQFAELGVACCGDGAPMTRAAEGEQGDRRCW
jgi:hypothetical protein